MNPFLGIVVEQSLRHPDQIHRFRIVATRKGRSWTMHLVSISEAELDATLKQYQADMVTDDNWYAHFFQGDKLVVVYRDAVFHVTVDPASWGPAVEHGLKGGIPSEQLDFTPRTVADAYSFFSMAAPAQA